MVNVTVTVIPAPELEFAAVSSHEAPLVVAGKLQDSGPGITFRGSANVMVCFDDDTKGKRTVFDFQKPGVKTFTAKELEGVNSVEVVYLGS